MPLERAHIMMFARSIGDHDPVFQDLEEAHRQEFDDVPAPPTFLHAGAHFDPVHHLRPRPGVDWHGSGATAGRRADGAPPRLHAEQHYELRRPLVAGETLEVSTSAGRTWQKEGRAGTLSFAETVVEYRDAEGEVVAVGRSVTVLLPPGPSA